MCDRSEVTILSGDAPASRAARAVDVSAFPAPASAAAVHTQSHSAHDSAGTAPAAVGTGFQGRGPGVPHAGQPGSSCRYAAKCTHRRELHRSAHTSSPARSLQARESSFQCFGYFLRCQVIIAGIPLPCEDRSVWRVARSNGRGSPQRMPHTETRTSEREKVCHASGTSSPHIAEQAPPPLPAQVGA